MVSDIRTAILNKVQSVYPITSYTYYKDSVPQNFKKPSFFISIIDHNYGKRIGNKYNGTLSFDLAYFSNKGTESIVSDCIGIQEILLQSLDYAGTYKILSKNARITDNVLHITFDVNYSEIRTETSMPMQTQAINLSL